jgi:hypothetical protein
MLGAVCAVLAVLLAPGHRAIQRPPKLLSPKFENTIYFLFLMNRMVVCFVFVPWQNHFNANTAPMRECITILVLQLVSFH